MRLVGRTECTIFFVGLQVLVGALEVAVNGSGLVLIGRHHVRCKVACVLLSAIYSTNGLGNSKG